MQNFAVSEGHNQNSSSFLPLSLSLSLSRADQLVGINGHSLLDSTLEEAVIMLASMPPGPVMLEVVRPDSTEPLNKLLAGITNDVNATSYSPG